MELIITELPLVEPKKTICLNMIVKNEAEIIADTLENILNAIRIDYWVISDTGSTDQTKEIICDFFQKKNIPGELVEHEWKDFAYNRTKALESAFMKTDYLLIFDADDRIEGKIVLPSLLHDSYMLQFGDGFRYLRSLLINNHKKWGFKGVLHEYLVELETMTNGSGTIEGNYFIISGRFGSRSKNPNKYYDDAIVLQNAFYKEMEEGDKGLACRYAFYCAQSYKDAGQVHHNDAIRWYEKVLELNNWSQEKYYACVMLGNLYAGQNKLDTAVRYWIKSSEYDGERIEGIVQAMECLRNKGDNIMVTMLYHKFKNYNKNVSNDKLFVDRTKYNDLIEYNNSICAYYVPGEKQSGYDCCKKIILNNSILPVFMQSTLSNVLFYKEFIEQDTDISSLLLNKGQNTPRFSKDICEKSKTILFYTGFSYDDWNYSYMKNNSLGGSERAVAYLSTYLPKEYTIYVAGGVTNETVDNVIYLHLNQLQDLINTTPFHTIICSRYVAFFEMFKEVSFHKFYIWAHDTTLLPYGHSYNQKFTDTQLITKWQHYIDGCICQTPWHAEIYKQRFPELKAKITIINNGIDTTFISSNTNAKRKNRFIYTSCSERGLHVLLELWAEILRLLPDASLVISSYNTFPSDKNGENDIKMKTIIDAYPQSITHRGKLSTEMLYQEMQSAEYWVYPTSFCETSCITAMEMLANGVICIYYPLAGLADTMQGYGFPVQNTKEILECLHTLNVNAEQKNEMRLKGFAYALKDCAWMNRAVEWTNLLFPEKKKKEMLQIINLKRRTDRKERMINALNAQQITNYDFSEAVDGKELVPSKELKQLFAANNFNYRKGVMGCALSHYNLWQQLLEDKDNEFYLIMEDDIELCKGFQKKIADLAAEMAKKDVIYLGYSRYSSAERKQVIAEFETITEETSTISLQKLNANRSGGGAFCYSIHKNAAKKYIDYIDKNGIKCAIDYVMLLCIENIESYEVKPLLVISEHTFDAPVIDTDIQTQYDCLEF